MCGVSAIRDSLYMAMMTPRATSINFWIYTNVMTKLWQNGRKGKAISIVPQRYKMRSWGSCHWVSQGALLSVSRKLNFSWWIRQECWHVQPWTADCLFLMVWFPAAARSAWRVNSSVWSLRTDITADTIVAVLRDCVLRLNLNWSRCRGLMLMVHQKRQGTGMEWQNMFPEKNQECCLPTVRCIHWIWQWMIWSRHQTREGCNSRDQLITYSPKWNTVSDELKERIAPDTPWFCVLCPTRWTVHAKSLKSVEYNYGILQKRVVAETTKQCLESSLLPVYSKHMQLLQYTSVHTDINVLVFVLLLLLLAQKPAFGGFPWSGTPLTDTSVTNDSVCMSACRAQASHRWCRTVAYTDTSSEPCTLYSCMESKQAECLHAGVAVDMQWHNVYIYV